MGNRTVRRRTHRASAARGHASWPARLWYTAGALAALAALGTLAAETPHGRLLIAAVQRFLLYYSGVFALVALTAAVGVGLVATDRIVLTPASRVVMQAVHRAVSVAALGFLAAHVLLEILAHRSHVIDAFIPFLAHGRTLYIGLGTIASDLVLLIMVTAVARRRFAGRWPRTWRIIHIAAYLAWPLAIVHGLTAGRTAKPYVDWSYGACVALVAVALLVRVVATTRTRAEVSPHPLPTPASTPASAAVSVFTPGPVTGLRPAAPARRALTAAPSRAGSADVPLAADPTYADQSAAEPPAPDPTAGAALAADPSAGDPSAGDPSAGDPSAGDPWAAGSSAEDRWAPDPTAGDLWAADPPSGDPWAPDPSAEDPWAAGSPAEDPWAPDPTAGAPWTGHPPMASDPRAAEPTAGHPRAGHPPTAGHPRAGHPPAGHPPAGEPVAGDPPAGEPVAGDPRAGDPRAGEPVAGEPVAGEPVAGDAPAEDPDYSGFSGRGFPDYRDRRRARSGARR